MPVAFQDAVIHNAERLTPVAGGQRPQRVAEDVRLALNDNAAQRMLEAAGMEVRFVSDGPVELTLSRPAEAGMDGAAVVFHGPFQEWAGRGGANPFPLRSQPVTLRVEPPPQPGNLPGATLDALPFSHRVARVMLPVMTPVVIHDIHAEAGDLRPPAGDELPGLTMLSYGTSITQGAGCSLPQLTYVHQCATRLGVDAINLGSSGSCRCEPALADDIAARRDWDFATLALSVNLNDVPHDAFREKVEYFVNTVAGADHARPVFCITLWPFFMDHGLDGDPDRRPDESKPAFAKERRRILADVVARSPHPNVRCLEGPTLLRDFGGLSQDLIHPGDHAMIEMGWRLAEAIAPHLPTDRAVRRNAAPV